MIHGAGGNKSGDGCSRVAPRNGSYDQWTDSGNSACLYDKLIWSSGRGDGRAIVAAQRRVQRQGM